MSATASSQVFDSVRTVGGLLPADMLIRIADGKDVSGSRPADYHVVGARSVKDEAERHWDYLKGAWKSVRGTLTDDSPDPSGLALENWLLPLFEELGFGRLQRTPDGIQCTDGTARFPVSHQWRHVPIHLASWDNDLDTRPIDGGLPPQSMLQECLNRSEAHLWGVLSNGRQLRLLRDSSSFAGAAYIEIDLTAMFDGELVDEFVLLYRLLHISRFEIPDGATPAACWLEKWRIEAIEAGIPFLNQLRDAVAEAIRHLGSGFLKHPVNARLRDDLDADLYKRALLRLIYRLLFWFAAEEREVLLDPDADQTALARYERYYSAARLRTSALRRTGTSHEDQWLAVKLVLNALGDENGLPRLGLIGLGGLYDHTGTDQILHGLQLYNEHLLNAVRCLARVRDESTKRWRKVDYRNLGPEELGSIYQSLLEFVPKWSKERREFLLDVLPGNERKRTGSYYTPTSLIDCLLDTALDPVLDDATKSGEIRATRTGTNPAAAIADALLAVTVCDPACGSGHFLVAAARRIAKRLAAVREHNPEPTLDALRSAVRDVVKDCIYGVDVNPLAVELAKVSLWMEAAEPGKPLGFLDAHIKCGDALIGATPALIERGIPDGAFKPIEGDDKTFAASLLRANAPVTDGQGELFSDQYIYATSNEQLAAQLTSVARAPDDSLRDVHRQAAAYREWEQSTENERLHEIADAWCAAIVWHKTKTAPPAIVNRVFRDLHANGIAAIPSATATEIARLRAEFGFFHWHLEFPDIFHSPGSDSASGWSGGFSCVLGNPPWDEIEFKDKEYFSRVEPSIAALPAKARRSRITEWQQENPREGASYCAERRKVRSAFHFAGDSGAFPLRAKGLTVKGVNSLQTDQLFAERFAAIVAPLGRTGCILPTAIATGAGGQYLFRDFTERGAVASLYDFENSKPLFPDVHRSYRFCLLTLTGRALREREARFAFFLLDTPNLDDPGRVFALAPEEITRINPNTGTLPIFRTRRDADLTSVIYHLVPALWNEVKPGGNVWNIVLKRIFNMTDDFGLFRGREELEMEGWDLDGNIFSRAGIRMLPLYEAKMAHHFDHRWNSYYGVGNEDHRSLTRSEKCDPHALAMPRYWIVEQGTVPVDRNGSEVQVPGVSSRLAELKWERNWLCGWRDVCRATDERTAIPTFLPRTAVSYTFPLMFPQVSPALTAALVATQSSMVFDYVSRQKIAGIDMTLFMWKQLPVPTPDMMEPHVAFITPRVLELVYTAYDMTPLARDLDDAGAPFRWDEDRRALLRAELDAFFFRLYGIERDDVDYIMETFPIVKQKDVAAYGSYRTKEMILNVHDRMASADAAGIPYETAITPPPGHGARHPKQLDD